MRTAVILIKFFAMILIRCLGFHNLQGVMRLHVQYVLFSIILFLSLERLVTYNFVFNMNSSKPWLLGVLLCVDGMLSGSGLYQLFLSTSLLGKGRCLSVYLVLWIYWLNIFEGWISKLKYKSNTVHQLQ